MSDSDRPSSSRRSRHRSTPKNNSNARRNPGAARHTSSSQNAPNANMPHDSTDDRSDPAPGCRLPNPSVLSERLMAPALTSSSVPRQSSHRRSGRPTSQATENGHDRPWARERPWEREDDIIPSIKDMLSVQPSLFDNVPKPVKLVTTSPSNPNVINVFTQPDSNAEDTCCLICADEMIITAFGPCNHRMCHRCCVRLRSLYKDTKCPFCKTEMSQLIIVSETNSRNNSFDFYMPIEELPHYDPALNIWFDSLDSYTISLTLLRFHCPVPDCEFVYDGPSAWYKLRLHVQSLHRNVMCDICTSHKRLFTYEISLYTRDTIHHHLDHGDRQIMNQVINPDQAITRGHPNCGFCNNRFFGMDELYEHCRKNHEECCLCKHPPPPATGVNDVYYRDYAELELHFAEDHFPCLHPECLEAKFMVFARESDLKDHVNEAHGQIYHGKQRAHTKEARIIATDFKFPPLPRHSSRARDHQDSQIEPAPPLPTANKSTVKTFIPTDCIDSRMKKGKAKATHVAIHSNDPLPGPSNSQPILPPPNFGRLTQSSISSGPNIVPNDPEVLRIVAEDEALAQSPLLKSVYLHFNESRPKLREFQTLTAGFMTDALTAREFMTMITQLMGLTPKTKRSVKSLPEDIQFVQNLRIIMDQMIESCPVVSKQQELGTALKEILPESDPVSNAQQRVLILRSGKAPVTRNTKLRDSPTPWVSTLTPNRSTVKSGNGRKPPQSPSSVWNASIAEINSKASKNCCWDNTLKISQSPPFNTHMQSTSSNHFPSSTKLSSPGPVNVKVGYKGVDFPSLPAPSSASSSQQVITHSNQPNQWENRLPTKGSGDGTNPLGSRSGRSKKGKGKEVLFRVGL